MTSTSPRFAFIIGTRPQYIKAAPLLREMDGDGVMLIDTGQHYDEAMSGAFYRELGIKLPARTFERDAPISALVGVLMDSGAEIAVVFGDTDSTLKGAMAAKVAGLKLVHVEAGVRSGNKLQAEEINRIIVDELSDVHVCPVEYGDLMYDALVEHDTGGYALATIHRQENTDRLSSLEQVLRCFSVIPAPVILLEHPRLAAAMLDFDLRYPDNVKVLPPTSYEQSIALQRGATLIITDSGGVQREASWLGVPIAVLRSETEWPDTIPAENLIDLDAKRLREIWGDAVSRRPRLRAANVAGNIADLLRNL